MRTPVWTVAVLLGAAIAYQCPSVASLFIYDRAAVLHGEVWRLVTSHLVHFDGWHLAYDLLAFGIASALVESKGRRHLCAISMLTAVSICAFLFMARPDMTAYGGLSGVACAVLTYLALSGLSDAWPWHTVCWSVLVVLAVKLGVECTTRASVLPYPLTVSFVPVWEAHAIGVGVALAYFAVQKLTDDHDCLPSPGLRRSKGSRSFRRARAAHDGSNDCKSMCVKETL